MFCSNCGEKLQDTVKFCSSCGNKVGGIVQTDNEVPDKENRDFSNKCKQIDNNDCVYCLKAEAVDDNGYYYCSKFEKTFKITSTPSREIQTVQISSDVIKTGEVIAATSFVTESLQKNKKISKTDQKLIMAAVALIGSLDKLTDKSLPNEIAKIVKLHSKGAAITAIGTGLLPGVGGTAATVASAGFIWSMYLRINKKIGLTISKSIIKTVAAGVATNLAAGVVAALVGSTILSLTGIGVVGASAIMGITCYALTLASGFIYLKILTNIFKAGKDPSTLSAEAIKEMANNVLKNENIKELIKKGLG